MMYLKDIKEDLNESIAMYKGQNEALGKAKVNTKKYGSEFKNLRKAVVNCEIGKYYWVEDNSHPYLTVYYKHNFKYDSIHIPVFGYMDELPETDERRKKYVRQFVRQTYMFSSDECNAAIKERIKQNEQKIISLKDQMERAETVYNSFMERVEKLKKELKENCGCNGKTNNSLYYDIIGTFTKE